MSLYNKKIPFFQKLGLKCSNDMNSLENKGILHWNLSQDINLNKESDVQKQLYNTSKGNLLVNMKS